jgi:hypothetical protein
MRIKKIVALIAILLGNDILVAQQPTTFTVIKVSGKVYSNALNREVKSKDVIKTSDNLAFNSRGAYLHVINPEIGRKTIRNVPDNSPREFMALLQGYLSQDKKNKTSRGAGSKGIEKIVSQLSYDTLLILASGRIPIDTTETSLSKPAGVIVTYRLNEKKTERIISDASGFNLSKKYLVGDMGLPYPKVIVNYCEDTGDPFFSPSVMLGSFVPYYVDEEALKAEVNTILDTYKSKPPSPTELIKIITSYLASEYATPVEVNVKDWLRTVNLLN